MKSSASSERPGLPAWLPECNVDQGVREATSRVLSAATDCPQAVCKACVLLEGLNRGRPQQGVGRTKTRRGACATGVSPLSWAARNGTSVAAAATDAFAPGARANAQVGVPRAARDGTAAPAAPSAGAPDAGACAGASAGAHHAAGTVTAAAAAGGESIPDASVSANAPLGGPRAARGDTAAAASPGAGTSACASESGVCACAPLQLAPNEAGGSAAAPAAPGAGTPDADARAGVHAGRVRVECGREQACMWVGLG